MNPLTGKDLYTRARDAGAAPWGDLDDRGKRIWRNLESRLSYDLGVAATAEREPEVKIVGSNFTNASVYVHGIMLDCVTRAEWSVDAHGLAKAVLYVDDVAAEVGAKTLSMEIIRTHGHWAPGPRVWLRRLWARIVYRKAYKQTRTRRRNSRTVGRA